MELTTASELAQTWRIPCVGKTALAPASHSEPAPGICGMGPGRDRQVLRVVLGERWCPRGPELPCLPQAQATVELPIHL